MKKPKLSIDEQISYMRDKKGIKFNIITEEEAIDFLHNSNYFFKLKSFCKNYDKNNTTGKYIDLEFAYLRELSTIDAFFRKIVLSMVLDVEHFLKVQLVRDCSDNEEEDGYTIVSEYLKSMKPRLVDELLNKSKNSYCHSMISKYSGDFAIWNIVETVSFGDFIDLYELYYSKYKNKYDIQGMLMPIKWIRNAAAHNNCLINNLRPPYSKEIKPNSKIMNKIAKIEDMPKRTRQNKMKNPVIHDFVTLLYVYCTVIESDSTVRNGLEMLSNFIHNRCVKHKDYFEENQVLKTNYEFLEKVIDFYQKSVYTKTVEQKTTYSVF